MSLAPKPTTRRGKIPVTGLRARGIAHVSVHLRHNRSDGRVRWSIALSISDTGLVASAASDHFLAVAERLRTYEGGTGSTQLLILKPETGAVLHRLRGEFGDLSATGDSLVVLEDAGGPGQARLYRCTLPECAKNPGVLLSAKEILRFQTYGDYILTWGIYDAACFSRATGERLW